MNQHDEDEALRFFEKLAGRGITGKSAESGSDMGVAMLRTALLDQIETVRAAETASKTDFTKDELARMDALGKLLVQKGLIGKGGAASQKSGSRERSNWWQWLMGMLSGGNKIRLVTVSVSFVFALAVSLQVIMHRTPEMDVVRGGSNEWELSVPNPVATIEALESQLRKAGADVLTVRLNNNEWSLRINVPKSADINEIQKILRANSVEVKNSPPYKLIIKSQH